MKIIIALLGLVLLMASCQKEDELIDLKSDFLITNNLLNVNEIVAIVNLSDSNATAYNWDFGDGFMSADKIPVHSYTTPGVYTIKLIIRDNSGNTDSTQQEVRVGERFVYEIIIQWVTETKWYSYTENWDEDSTGINALPDVLFIVGDTGDTAQYQTATVYNLDNSMLPYSFAIPEVKIKSTGTIGIGSTGIYMQERDGNSSYTMASNLMSGVSCSNNFYDNATHRGEFTVGFYCTYTVKYNVR